MEDFLDYNLARTTTKFSELVLYKSYHTEFSGSFKNVGYTYKIVLTYIGLYENLYQLTCGLVCYSLRQEISGF